jgi:anthranilate phosphoribosyltransferase|tara:strand:- start:700 stop:1698 length:999 start_codon:yes stop_codon:yes gene_type:complete
MPTEHAFAPYVRALGKGKLGSRSLTQNEAHHAMSMILQQQVEPEQLGAFLMLLRVKEETPAELAGFVKAVRQFHNYSAAQVSGIEVDIDWSSYAGKKRHLPWFLLSALTLAGEGIKVFMHGAKGHTQGRVYSEDVLLQLGLPVAEHWAQVEHQLASSNFSFMSLKHLSPPLQHIISLRATLGLRSPVHTLTRLLNPLAAKHTIDGVFHPAYGPLHQQTAMLLKHPRSLTIRGDGGEAEVRPDSECELQWVDEQVSSTQIWQRTLTKRDTQQQQLDPQRLRLLWRNEQHDAYGEAAVISTLACCLVLLGKANGQKDATELATRWWQNRNRLLM